MVEPPFIEQLEDLEDALDIEASANDPHRRTIPAAVVDRLLDDEHPLEVRREHRGPSRSELAARTGLTPGHIGHLETGRRHGTPDTRRRPRRHGRRPRADRAGSFSRAMILEAP